MKISRIDLIGQNGNTGEHYMSDGQTEYEREKREALVKLKEQGYNVNPHHSRAGGTIEPFTESEHYEDKVKRFIKNDGGSANYYELPEYAKELYHLIHHKKMSHPVGEAFCSLYRLDDCPHSDAVRNLKKVIFYCETEINNRERERNR